MLANWVKETSDNADALDIDLAGAITGFIAFVTAFGDGDVVNYAIEDGNDREIGMGIFNTGTPNTITRTLVLETLVSGTYDNTAPVKITMTSAAVVSIAASTHAFLPGKAKNINIGSNTYLPDPWRLGINTTRTFFGTRVYLMQYYITSPVTLSGLGIDLIALGDNPSTMHLGLYRINDLDLVYTLIDETGSIDISTSGGTTGFNTSNFAGGNMVLRPGVYGISMGSDSSTGSVAGFTSTYGNSIMLQPDEEEMPSQYYTDGAYSAGLPTTFTPTSRGGQIGGSGPRIFGVIV